MARDTPSRWMKRVFHTAGAGACVGSSDRETIRPTNPPPDPFPSSPPAAGEEEEEEKGKEGGG